MIRKILGAALVGVLVSGVNLGLIKLNTRFEQKRRRREFLSKLHIQIIELIKCLERMSPTKESVLTHAIQLKELDALVQKCFSFIQQYEENGSSEYTPYDEVSCLSGLAEAFSSYNNAHSNEGDLKAPLMSSEKAITDCIRKLDSELSAFYRNGGWLLSYLPFG